MGRAARILVFTVIFLVVLVAFEPASVRTVIDGEEETWVHTVICWEYRVPFDSHSAIANWFPILVPVIVATILCCALVLVGRLASGRSEPTSR